MTSTVQDEQIRKVASAFLPTVWGNFTISGFERTIWADESIKSEVVIALTMGDFQSGCPLVRIHSQCLTGDALGSLRCDCGPQLHIALELIAKEKAGLLLYEDKEGRGIGILDKLRAYELQDSGADTIEAMSSSAWPLITATSKRR